MTKPLVIDISWKRPYPGGDLSNFEPRAFMVDDVPCASMEGFLQGLKFSDPQTQRSVCQLIGEDAKAQGQTQHWQTTGLWWQGRRLDRFGDEYQTLLTKAYDALAEHPAFKAAMRDTETAILTHDVGKDDPTDTVLTRDEFCAQMRRLRRTITGY